ncbi:hypothetical protein AYL99_00447 [Fonsecaea erecta]|uniref:Uncharacterized protein n=1 Tax=Fonsecaea erecta TaxID=1367422 RepID=A0A178ZZR9_9EURO|nr:hypothetical protein AYL99_00447 [Fonsecaea erecta]OAP64475.1 hypothetical protein AYL99_00447 [Fonsecaea erecta]
MAYSAASSTDLQNVQLLTISYIPDFGSDTTTFSASTSGAVTWASDEAFSLTANDADFRDAARHDPHRDFSITCWDNGLWHADRPVDKHLEEVVHALAKKVSVVQNIGPQAPQHEGGNQEQLESDLMYLGAWTATGSSS